MALIAVPVGAALWATLGTSSGRAQSGYTDPIAGPVAVRVDPSAVQRRIPAGFMGLSIEYWALENYAGPNPHAVNPVLVQLIRNLFPSHGGVLRIGGVTTDKTWWPVPGVPQPKGVNFILNKRRVAVAGALAGATGARLIMGIQFEADSSTIAGAEARAILANISRSRLAAFELGNEPELFGNPNFGWYTVNGHPVPGRPIGYDVSAFTHDFTNIGRALPRQVPLAGPSSSVGQWIGDLRTFLNGSRRVGLITLHRYPFQACVGGPSSPEYPTLDRLLSPAGSTESASGLAPYVANAHARHLPVLVDEMNAASCGNPPGITNSFALALWVVDALFADAAVGVDGVDVHTWPGAIYQLFTSRRSGGGWRMSVYPEYYGLMLFAKAAPPGSSLVRASTSNAVIRAWATRGPGGTVHVALINDDTSRARSISVRISGVHGGGSLELLRAPSVFSQRGVTLANQGFGAETSTGQLTGQRRATTVSSVRGVYSLRLPPASAGLLTLG